MTRALQDQPDGVTRLEMRVARPKPKDKDFVDQVGHKFGEDVTEAIAKLRRMLEGQPASVAAIEEPPLPPSNKRFVTEPVKSGTR
jgi:hypothetical protein